MKRTISLVIASAAVAMALVSCTKEITANNEGEKGFNADGTRTLTVSFASKSTKTTLDEDGRTPVWAEGDQISLNGTAYDVPAAAIGTSSCTITTDIQGDIVAVYPAAAYQSTEPYFKVSDEQDGSFGCANICVAEAAAGVNTLTFQNVTAVFAVAVPSGTTKLTVTSLGKIDSTTGQRGTAAEDKAAINTTGEGDAAKVITVEKSDKSEFGDSVYVAVAVDTENGVLLTDLNFDTGSAQGGISPNYIKSKGKDPLEYKAVAGYIYTPVLHEYVVVGGKKWATMNVGATALTGTGDYYMWGAVEKPYSSLSGKEFTFYSEKPSSYINNTWNASKGFSSLNSQFTNNIDELSEYGYGKSDVLTKYSASNDGNSVSGTADGKTVLESKDDAATYNWGSTWRMPSGGNASEFIALYNATYWAWDETDKGYYVYAPNPSTDAGKSKDGTGNYDKFDALLFFPAGGMGIDRNISHGGKAGVKLGGYWTRTLNSEKPFQAHHFNFANDTGVNTDVTSSNARSMGFLIRPVSD